MDNSRKLRRRWVIMSAAVVTVLVMLALAAACGGDDEEAETGGDGPEPTTTREAGPTGAERTAAATAEPPGNGGSAAAIDACALITREEVEAAVGKSVGDGESQNTPPVFGCTYRSADFDLVHVAVVVWDSAEQAGDVFQLAIDNNDYPEIEGIGDRAYDARPLFGITVLNGKYEVSVDVISGGDEDEFELAKDLVKKAVDRLP
ncbi:MAG: hypothetical protein Q7T33_03795 [Dehalococcoidia bacterium]|nr:hypothetical protein [Dehalococcoidia bacterium]